MSLITRCPSCGTMFKVVPDQLKIAQGWVRCGHCSEVFDARQSMQTGESGKALPAAGAEQAPASPGLAQIASSTERVDEGILPAGTDRPDAIGASAKPVMSRPVPRWIAEATQDASSLSQTESDQQIADHERSLGTARNIAPADEFDPAAWKAAQARHHNAEPVAESAVDSPVRASVDAPSGLSRPAALESPSSPVPLSAASALPQLAAPRLWGRVVRRDESEDESYLSYAFDDSEYLASSAASATMPIQGAPVDSSSELSFVHQAQRGSFWRQRRMRVWLALIGVLLAAIFILQATLQYRDVIAARAPGSVPLLTSLCRVAGCVIEPLRRIDSVSIDSSTFNKTGSDAFRLSFVLKNAAATALRVPSLEVTLTDLQNQVVARRVVSPSQFGVTVATIGPRTEMPGVLNIRIASDNTTSAAASLSAAGAPSGASQLSVAGYRVLAFYP